ncbi:hypothetical protein LCGC14_0738670 [marine sediment metagenome]|uniref:Uncharacterized protein n=1 Tax=marine sediment metagenome TaxID=412755 RepID=A0A0F9QSF1_9ZZZZ
MAGDIETPTKTLRRKLEEMRAQGVVRILEKDLRRKAHEEKWPGFRFSNVTLTSYSPQFEDALLNLKRGGVVWTHPVPGQGTWVILVSLEELARCYRNT